MSVALSIAFTGLCALVADGNGAPGQILLLDAKGIGQVGGVTLPDHAPTLMVSLRDLANPETSQPTRVIVGTLGHAGRMDQLGLWDLRGSEIRIRTQGAEGTGVQLFRPTKVDTSWPASPRDVHNPASWRDLRYVPDMKAISGDGRIDPALLRTDPIDATRLPPSVAARIHLDSGLLEAAIPSLETFRDDVFEFRSEGSDRVVRQPLTDTVQWTLQTDSAAVVIDIIPVGGGPAKRLLLGPSAMPRRLFISNLPAENPSHADAHHAMSQDEMSALHFGAYYKLLLNEPANKPMPEVWQPPSDRKGAGFLRTAFCPAALFSGQ